MESHGGRLMTGEKRRTREKYLPQCYVLYHKFFMNDPNANPGLRCERPTANRLSHGTALSSFIVRANETERHNLRREFLQVG
jgi:hypothetical protein